MIIPLLYFTMATNPIYAQPRPIVEKWRVIESGKRFKEVGPKRFVVEIPRMK